MGVIHWFNPDTHDTQFTVEFDDSDVSSEFSELVYGLIENADGLAHRRNETITSQRECIKQLREDLLEMSHALADALTPPLETLESDVEYGASNPEYNDMGGKAYAKNYL